MFSKVDSIWLLSQDKRDVDKRKEDGGKEETCPISLLS